MKMLHSQVLLWTFGLRAVESRTPLLTLLREKRTSRHIGNSVHLAANHINGNTCVIAGAPNITCDGLAVIIQGYTVTLDVSLVVEVST